MRDFERAYRFLYEYKQHFNSENLCLTDDEFGMLIILAKEFSLPIEASENISSSQLLCLIQQIFVEDSKWNRALCNALDSFYNLIESEQEAEGIRALKSFINSCPASWYRSHAETELENIRS